MKKILSFVVALALLITSASALASTYDNTPNGCIYDTAELLSQPQIDELTEFGRLANSASGLCFVTYIVPSLSALTPEEYANIIWNVRSNISGDADKEVLTLADAETSALFVICGSAAEIYLPKADVDACLEKATAANQSGLYDHLITFYKSAALCMIDKIENGQIAQPEPDAQSGATTSELDAQIMTDTPLYVQSTRLIIQSEDQKASYPDLLEAILVNDSNSDIKNVAVAFMAWDKNNLPILLKDQFSTIGEYVKQAEYEGVNMIPGSTYGEDTGFKLNRTVEGIVTIKAIVVSYETFDGEIWTNPYYEQYIEEYAGKKLQ